MRPRRNQLPLGQRYASGTEFVRTRWTGLQVTDSSAGGLVRSVEGREPAVLEFASHSDFDQKVVQSEPAAGGLRVAGTNRTARRPQRTGGVGGPGLIRCALLLHGP
ncbi:trehalase-like domain-containing protein [Lentzea sp. NPDC051208]|uniref:trehalase-like domain-containing protein n=1 Tax=Lentzea sp. NPDC051208 TaxID=3154642 RepID=UPI0034469E53